MKKFKLDFSFVVLLGIIALSPKQYIISKLLLCLLLHELGHLFFILIFKYKIESLKLSIFGFFLKLEHTKEVFYKDFIIYSGGIIFNILFYLCIPDPTMRKINLILILFNSLPVYPLDGFNMIKTLASYFFPYKYVLKTMSIFGLLVSTIAILLSVYFRMDLFLIFNACYLFLLSMEYYFKCEELYQKFLLEKTIYKYNYPLKKIKFHMHLNAYFYKYHKVEMLLGNKIIGEEELFQAKKLF